MDRYQFSSASYDDIPEIVSIYNGLVGTPGCAWDYDYPSRATAESDIKNNCLYRLKMDEKVVAVASVGEFHDFDDLHWTPKNPCELARIGVVSTMQNQGIGTIILQYMITMAKEKRYDGIILAASKTNPAALALYEKNGFERCGEVFRFDTDFYCYQINFNSAK